MVQWCLFVKKGKSAYFPQDICSVSPESSYKVLLRAWDAEDIAVTGGWNGIFFDYPARYLRPYDEVYQDISGILFDGYRFARGQTPRRLHR